TYDCDHNGLIDSCESSITDCNGNGVPDSCDVTDNFIYVTAQLGDTGKTTGFPAFPSEPIGTGFHLDKSTRISAVGRHLGGGGSVYITHIVNGFPPIPSPGQSWDNDSSWYIAKTQFTAPNSSVDFTIPFVLDLPPGDYALLFRGGFLAEGNQPIAGTFYQWDL